MKRLIIFLIIAFVLVAIPLSFITAIFFYGGKAAGTDLTPKVIVISPGESFNKIAERLHQDSIITSPLKFRIFARIKKYDKHLKAGEYQLSGSMSPDTILNIMVNGEVLLHKLTVPEGYNLRQIASLIAGSGLGAEKDFLTVATDPIFTRKMAVQAENLEGYLFPDTYFFPKDASPEKIISSMVNRFRAVFTLSWEKQARKKGFSIHQVVTLASIIEKETGAPAERPIISSVFHNRLKRRMRLESDPTVIYGIKDYDGNITKKHLAEKTPYNTYKIKGLPPGPIANPGEKAIEAALYPADTRFLYFVSKKDSTHKFSTSIKEHNRAVRKYQLKKRR